MKSERLPVHPVMIFSLYIASTFDLLFTAPPEIITPLVNANYLDDAVVNKIARRRWHLIYTLLRNPEMIKLRKGYIPLTHNTGDSDAAIASKTV